MSPLILDRVCVLLTLLIGMSQLSAAERPNVLMIAVDDMNDWVGFLGGYPGQVYTPHLDRLAAQGTAFTNAHTAAPVCCPSRVAAMSGLLPSTSGIYNNQQWWKPHNPHLLTIPIHFQRHGYQTIGAGKIFHHTAGNNPPQQWQAYKRLPFNDNAWIRAGSPLYPDTKPAARPAQFPFCGLNNYSEEVDWGVLPNKQESEYDDAVITQYAIDFLESAASQDKPFFLACGIFHPHLPWYVPQRYLDLYPVDDVHVPPIDLSDLDDIPAAGRQLALRKADNLEMIRTAGKWPTAIQHYLASISFADAQVGRLLETLRKTPHAQNTVIVLWSDHGWHLGEKGHWHKRTLWEEATRVPLIVCAPHVGTPGQQCSQPVSLVDLFPTLSDLCDLPAPPGLDGMSLVSWLKKPRSPRSRPAVIVEEQGHLAIRSQRYRLIRYADATEELYDHHRDPGEIVNLATLPELQDVKAALASHFPRQWAKPAQRKSAYDFNPYTYSWKHKKTGEIVSGNRVE